MTGISVGDYKDPEKGLELGELMQEVACVDGVERVRLSSVEVIHVRDSLLDALESDERVCPHLHVPMQSGDDGVLEAMGRHYDSDGYRAAIESPARARPRCQPHDRRDRRLPDRGRRGFRTHTRAGARLPASPRSTHSASRRGPGTDADRYGDPVSPQEKKRRSQAMRGLSEVLGRHHRAAKLDSAERVLVDKVADTQVSGYSRDYTRHYLPAGAAAAGAADRRPRLRSCTRTVCGRCRYP